MADVRPFRALRYDLAHADPALTIAPPYDVISPEQQAALYRRSPHNIVRIEYGEQRASDDGGDNRYTRAARDLDAWLRAGVLRDAEPAVYAYRQEFEWDGSGTSASALRRGAAGGVRRASSSRTTPLSGPRRQARPAARDANAGQPRVLRVPARSGAPTMPETAGDPLYDVEADGQRHVAVGRAGRRRTRAIRCASRRVRRVHRRWPPSLRDGAHYRNEVRPAARAGPARSRRTSS
jgi:hypothetical protein